MSLVAILVAISAGVVSPSEPGFGGRVEEIENVQMTVSRGNPVLLTPTKATIGHISKRATNTTKLIDPTITYHPFSKIPASMSAEHPSVVQLQAAVQTDQEPPEHGHSKEQRYLPTASILPFKHVQLPGVEHARDKILLQARPDSISHETSMTKPVDTAVDQKEHKDKHTGLVDSNDSTAITELDPVLYSPSKNGLSPYIHAGSSLPIYVHRRLPTLGLATNWAEIQTSCSDSACDTANGGCTITLSDDFAMGAYGGEISFSGKTITLWGQGKVLDASGGGRFFSGSGSGSFLELHDAVLQNGQANQVWFTTFVL